jgi:uncharacterized protein (DUF983 family)
MQADDIDDDPENPDPSDMDQDDYTITVRCPNCRKFIDEEAEQCPICGHYVTKEDPDAKPNLPWWVIVGLVVALAVIICFWVA